MKTDKKHNGSFFKSLCLLAKTLVFAAAYALLWLGIIFIGEKFGPVILTLGAAVCIFALISCIIAPLSKKR